MAWWRRTRSPEEELTTVDMPLIRLEGISRVFDADTDEPTGNLDSAAGDTVMGMLKELHTAGSTICLASHDPRYIAMAERHIYLFDGAVAGAPVA
jgi:predicted ABC-type transport system involved in lysophospholipase L1 biosynthesis ATPase subunit